MPVNTATTTATHRLTSRDTCRVNILQRITSKRAKKETRELALFAKANLKKVFYKRKLMHFFVIVDTFMWLRHLKAYPFLYNRRKK